MGDRRFITVNRVMRTLYWECPNKSCYQPHTMIEDSGVPKTIHCICGFNYIIEKVTQVTQFTARLLIEVKQ